eukprot:421234-Pelagomonas_calceolata.AAC.3
MHHVVRSLPPTHSFMLHQPPQLPCPSHFLPSLSDVIATSRASCQTGPGSLCATSWATAQYHWSFACSTIPEPGMVFQEHFARLAQVANAKRAGQLHSTVGVVQEAQHCIVMKSNAGSGRQPLAHNGAIACCICGKKAMVVVTGLPPRCKYWQEQALGAEP